MGKESKRRVDVYVYVVDSFFCASEPNITLQINYSPIENFLNVQLERNIKCTHTRGEFQCRLHSAQAYHAHVGSSGETSERA